MKQDPANDGLFYSVVKGRCPGHFNQSRSKAPHCMLGNSHAEWRDWRRHYYWDDDYYFSVPFWRIVEALRDILLFQSLDDIIAS